MAHRLIADAASKCAVPHGHNEFVSVTLEPSPSDRSSTTTSSSRPSSDSTSSGTPAEVVTTSNPAFWKDCAIGTNLDGMTVPQAIVDRLNNGE